MASTERATDYKDDACYKKLDKESLSTTIFDILDSTDLTQITTEIDIHPEPSENVNQTSREADLEWLSNEGLIKYWPHPEEYKSSYVITMLNRSKLEQTYTLAYSEVDPNYKQEKTISLVYYDPTTGVGLFNGSRIGLKGKNKAMFDVLVTSPNEWIDKEIIRIKIDKVRRNKNRNTKIDSIAIGNTNKSGRIKFNENITYLRRACKTNNEYIEVNRQFVRLNAMVKIMQIPTA